MHSAAGSSKCPHGQHVVWGVQRLSANVGVGVGVGVSGGRIGWAKKALKLGLLHGNDSNSEWLLLRHDSDQEEGKVCVCACV